MSTQGRLPTPEEQARLDALAQQLNDLANILGEQRQQRIQEHARISEWANTEIEGLREQVRQLRAEHEERQMEGAAVARWGILAALVGLGLIGLANLTGVRWIGAAGVLFLLGTLIVCGVEGLVGIVRPRR